MQLKYRGVAYSINPQTLELAPTSPTHSFPMQYRGVSIANASPQSLGTAWKKAIPRMVALRYRGVLYATAI